MVTDMTKWSGKLHGATVLVVFVGLLAVLGAWLAGETGRVFGLTQQHLYNDATVLLLLAIGLGVGTVIHLLEEKGR